MLKPDDIPRFKINTSISSLSKEIDSLLSKTRSMKLGNREVTLRKRMRVRSVNSSLAIEGNGQDLLNVRDIINDKRVECPFDEILEIKNTNKAYSRIGSIDTGSIDDFLSVHDDMMFGLVENPGFRQHGACVTEGDRVVYRAPPYETVPELMSSLFDWCDDNGPPAYITGAVFHYYVEKIHPFEDGNGRIGRLWHTAMLCRYDRVFRMVPIESRIHSRQDEYYRHLESDMDDHDCTGFVRFCLEVTRDSLSDLLHLVDPKMDRLLKSMGNHPMSSSEIMGRMGVSNKTYFIQNYLRPAMEYGFVEMTEPDTPRSRNQKYRKALF